MRLRIVVGLSALWVVVVSAPAPASTARGHSCGMVDGVVVQAYNLSCGKARSIFGGQPPRGWTAGNLDVAGGLAFYCRSADEEKVTGAINQRTGRVRARRLHGAPLVIAAEPYGESRTLHAPAFEDRAMRTPRYRSCVAGEPALAMVGDLHHVSFRTACRLTKRIATYPWPESDRIKITRWCWNDLGRVRSFEDWNVTVRGVAGPATLSRGGRWFAFQGQEFPISCI